MSKMFEGPQLMLDDRNFPGVMSRQVRASVRIGPRKFNQGPLQLLATRGGYLPQVVWVERVRETTVEALTDADVKSSGFDSYSQLVGDLASYYPKIKGTTPVTVIEFSYDVV